jgi:hypothetical protein
MVAEAQQLTVLSEAGDHAFELRLCYGQNYDGGMDRYMYIMKWPRYQRVIILEKQVGITSQRNKWANTDLQMYLRWNQVPRRSKHPPLTGRTRLKPNFKFKNR